MKLIVNLVFLFCYFAEFQSQITFNSYLTTNNPDTKISFAHSLWEDYIRNQPDSLRYLAADLFHFGEVNKSETARYFSKRILGCYLIRKGDFKNGEKELKKALIFHRKHGDKLNETEDLNELGIASFLKGDYYSAQSFFQLSIQSGKELVDKKYTILAELNLAKTYDKLNLREKAEAVAKHYLRECLELKKFESVSNAYGFLSDLALNSKNLELAEEYLNKSLKASMNSNNQMLLAQVYANLGAFSATTNEYKNATKYLQKSLEIRQQINHTKGIIEAYYNLAYLAYLQKDYRASEKTYVHALSIARENKFLVDEIDILTELEKIQKELNNKDLELQFYKELLEAKSKQAEIVLQDQAENRHLIDYFQDEKILSNIQDENVQSKFWTGFLVGFSSLLLLLIGYYFIFPKYSTVESRNYDQ
jgi:tetratricopeptide (TPR) repeat protein